MSLNEDQLPQGWSDGAQGYEEHFAGFTSLYADEMLDRLGVGAGTRLLDVAAGTGATSVRAAQRGAVVLSTDFAPGMVEVAARRLRDGGFAGCAAAVMDGQSLDVEDDSIDAATSMFGLMFFPDPLEGMRELARVVRPAGRVGTATWDLEGFGMHRLIGGALEVALPGIGAGPPPTPTWAPLGTPQGLSALLVAGGLDEVQVVPTTRRWHFEDPVRFFHEMPSWSSPVRPLFEQLPEELLDAAAAAFGDLVTAAGGRPGGAGIEMTALIGTGTVV